MGQKRFYIPKYKASGMADENISAETLAAIEKMCGIAYNSLNSIKPNVRYSYVVGQKYIIDAKFNNGGEVLLMQIYGEFSCRVKDLETNGEWDTLLHRLTPHNCT